MDFRLPIDNGLSGQKFTSPQFPELAMTYLRADPNQISLDFNGTMVLLDANDVRTSRVHLVGDRYVIQVVRAFPDALVFSVKDTLRVERLNVPFNVDLEENRGTGFTWAVSTTPGLDILQGLFINTCPAGLLGCPGTRRFILVGTTLGDHIFTAHSQRGEEMGQVENILVRVV